MFGYCDLINPGTIEIFEKNILKYFGQVSGSKYFCFQGTLETEYYKIIQLVHMPFI